MKELTLEGNDCVALSVQLISSLACTWAWINMLPYYLESRTVTLPTKNNGELTSSEQLLCVFSPSQSQWQETQGRLQPCLLATYKSNDSTLMGGGHIHIFTIIFAYLAQDLSSKSYLSCHLCSFTCERNQACVTRQSCWESNIRNSL